MNSKRPHWSNVEMHMLLNEGDKILVANRRLFEKDEVRFFIGRVDAYEAGVVKATGHSYVRDLMDGGLIEKEEERTKILPLFSGTLLVYLLPAAVKLDTVKFVAEDGGLLLTDGKGFTMNLAEHAHGGHV